MKNQVYTIHRVAKAPSLEPTVGVPAKGWEKAEIGTIAKWHKRSENIRPTTYFRALYDAHNIYVRFDVMDSFVKVVHTHLNDSVCLDSCVEFFVQPAPGPTYFNFEINAGGTMLLYRITDPTRTNSGFVNFAKVPEEWAKQVEIYHSMPKKVVKPIQEPIAWSVVYRIPIALFTACLGECSVKKGDEWRGNFYKCGGSEHYGMWSDVGAALNFHQPKKFAKLVFG